MRVLVACGAGASSTFVAMRMRRAASSRGVDVTAKAVALEDIAGLADTADVLLLGAHLRSRGDEVAALAERAGLPYAVMPERVFSAQDGSEALDLAIETAGEER